MWRFMAPKDSRSNTPSQPESKPKTIRTDSEISSLDLGPSVENAHRKATNLVPPEVKITPPPESDQDVAGTHGYNQSPVEENNDVNSPSERTEHETETPRQRGGRVAAVFRTISTPLLSPLRSSTSSDVRPRPGVYRARTSFLKRREE